MADPTDPYVRERRREIDSADEMILAALNDRITAVTLLHDHKVRCGYPLSDPGREEEIVRRLSSLNAGPISAAAVPDVVAAILALTRSEVSRMREQGWGS
jgi:chorismate mutase/prephenate dehydratase